MYPAPPVTSVVPGVAMVDVVLTVRHCTVRHVIVAVVVTYSAPANMLERCIGSLRSAGGVDHIVVVDTGGHAVPSDPAVELIQTDNRGYGAAANRGFSRALSRGATAIALLNDDVTVHSGWLPPLLAELSTENVGAAQPKLLVAGSVPARINSLGVQLGPDGAGTDIGIGDIDVVVGPPADMKIFTGGAVVFTPAFLTATGGFDERYFLYYEDVDLALRGRSLGWRYRLVPASVVEHVGGASTGHDGGATRYHQERNRLRAVFRHADAATILRAVWLSLRRMRHQPHGAHLRALVAGLAGAPVQFYERFRKLDRRHLGISDEHVDGAAPHPTLCEGAPPT